MKNINNPTFNYINLLKLPQNVAWGPAKEA